jgi:hypothetical protein
VHAIVAMFSHRFDGANINKCRKGLMFEIYMKGKEELEICKLIIILKWIW